MLDCNNSKKYFSLLSSDTKVLILLTSMKDIKTVEEYLQYFPIHTELELRSIYKL